MKEDAKMTKKKEAFVEITKEEFIANIKEEFDNLNDKLDAFCKTNDSGHDEIMKRQDKTNGKVKLAHWIATTAMALITTLIFLLMSGIIR